jgi:hypothetical protein
LADYRFQNWGSLRSNTGSFGYENSERASVGLEISNKKVAYNSYFETSFIQAGLYYNRSYLIVNGKPIDDMGATAGFGINAKRTPLSLNVVLQYGIRGTTSNNLVRESYFAASFIFSYRDFWLTKGRRFD